jgi:hypothetical protein
MPPDRPAGKPVDSGASGLVESVRSRTDALASPLTRGVTAWATAWHDHAVTANGPWAKSSPSATVALAGDAPIGSAEWLARLQPCLHRGEAAGSDIDRPVLPLAHGTPVPEAASASRDLLRRTIAAARCCSGRAPKSSRARSSRARPWEGDTLLRSLRAGAC